MYLFSSFFKSKKWALWAWGGAFVIGLTTYTKVQLIVKMNSWYNDYYTILGEPKKYKIDDFWSTIMDFMYIVIPYVILAMVINFFTRIYVLRWREAVTFTYAEKWSKVNAEIEGASQRIQEDIFRFARIMEDMAVKMLRAILTLVAFTPILWGLSKGIDIPLVGEFEGSLFWSALFITF
ncbi:MAG: SbmA/BacA-like family transporter, partial [Alphaproteobacteria bacterium]